MDFVYDLRDELGELYDEGIAVWRLPVDTLKEYIIMGIIGQCMKQYVLSPNGYQPHKTAMEYADFLMVYLNGSITVSRQVEKYTQDELDQMCIPSVLDTSTGYVR